LRRQLRIAAKRAAPAAEPVVDVEVDVLAVPFAEAFFEEPPPHAAMPTLARAQAASTAAGRVALLRLMGAT
jgi:hypothetical protein